MSSLKEALVNVKSDVVSSVKDADVVAQATKAIDDSSMKIKSYAEELIAKGRASEVGKLVEKCLVWLKEQLSKLVGYCKELWAKIIAYFSASDKLKMDL
jgi:hypothetical protein